MDDRPHMEIDPAASSAPEPGEPGPAEPEVRRAELRAAVKRGLRDIEEGRVADLEGALDRIEAMLDELEAIRRPQG